MREFNVTFTSWNGQEDSCTVLAPSDIDAARQVLAAGNTPLRVRARSGGWTERLRRPLRSPEHVSLADIALFSEQLSEMLNAGVTVEQGLDLIAHQGAREQTSRLAMRLLEKVRAGCALSEALMEERSIPRFYSGLIRGSERGGRLADGFGYLGDYLMRQATTRNKMLATLTYPAVVIATAVFALGFVLIVVIPEFAPLFSGEEANLPLVTRLVLWLSEVVTTRAEMMAIGIVGSATFIWLLSRTMATSSNSAVNFLKRFPPVELAIRLDVAKSIRALGSLLASGVDASEAAFLANESATSKWVKSGLTDAARRIREGTSLSEALRNISVIPVSVTSLIEVGERTGDVGRAALRAANLLESETNRRIDQLVSLLNPIAIVLLGGMIAVLISGVMLGILSANQFALR